jgi:hypothetical protein
VLRALPFPAVAVFVIGLGLASSARAQDAAATGSLSAIPLPGGIDAALATLGDRVAPDRSQFLLEFIRRTYNRPLTIKNHHRQAVMQSLVAHFERSSITAAPALETVPLPLPTNVWIDAVFQGKETPRTLVSAILRTRGAALLYYGLLSLDDPTRAWIAAQPSLLRDAAAQHAAAFLVAAPGIRVANGTLVLPGGDSATQSWQALVGRPANEPEAFIRTLLSRDEGRLAYFFGTFAQLTPQQLRFALRLDADVEARTGAIRRLRAVFERVTNEWRVDDSAFWRPALEPALLAASLPLDDAGRLQLPGSREFWTAVFATGDRRSPTSNGGHAEIGVGEPVDFVWLCEHVFTGGRIEDRRRYQLVLFASRIVRKITSDRAHDAVAVVRAAHEYPALIAALERARLRDVSAFAAAARRAATISAVDDRDRAARVHAQFQGALALLARVAVRGGLTSEALANAVSSLSRVELSERGDYEGRLVRWCIAWLDAHVRHGPAAAELDVPAAGPVERDVIAALAGPIDTDARFVEWEGTRYRLDFAQAEALRIVQLLGDRARPFLSSARGLVTIADAVGARDLSGERLQQQAAALRELGQAAALDRSENWAETETDRRYRDASSALTRAAQSGDTRSAARVASPLLLLADELLARGLMEMAYAVALGHPDRPAISADEAARRHEFAPTVGAIGQAPGWVFPSAAATPSRAWHASGSLLGLDVRLADFSLVPLSSRPPPRRPTLDDDRRRVLVETVVLMTPSTLTDEDQTTIVAAMQKGRTRLAAVKTAAEATALADEIRLGPLRRSLLPWVLANEPDRLAAFLSPTELFWLGLDKIPIASRLHAWGAPAEPRFGCLCLELLQPHSWETLAGRWHSGILSSGFPDLNLRLAELLAELRMPASLLAPVLAAATLDLVDTAAVRDSDDRRALVEFVSGLRPVRVEQYLALLTADGPLVPVEPGGVR